MSIKLDCPRCKTLLQVPNKLAGGYVNCPHCKGRLWVSKDAAVEKTPPYGVAVYNFDEISLDVGRLQYEGDLEKLVAFEQTPEDKRWAGYSPDVQEMYLPPWAAQ